MYQTKQESVLETIQNSKPLQNLVVTHGIIAYKNVINTHKCHLFEEKNNIYIGSPSLDWANRSITDLTLLVEKLSEGLTKDSYNYKSVKSIIKNGNEIKERLTNNLESYRGFIENGNWSILNKVDTNYSNWVKLMIPILDEGKLGSGTIEQKIIKFFEQNPIISVLSQEDIEIFKGIENKYGCSLETISYAEYQLYKDYLNNYKTSKSNIGRTTYIGDLEENNFKQHLGEITKKTKKSVKSGDIIDFSSPGNQVDQVFGIDFLINLYINGRDKKWIPVQIKARKKNSEYSLILKSNIGGIVVFPAQNFEIKMKGRYGFFDMKGGEERSFDEIFLKS
jgi:hypothetical protein